MNNSQQNNAQQRFRPVDEMSYEQARDELIEVVRILELGQMSLDESLNYWERGEELSAYCEQYLDGASSRIEKALAARESGGDSEGESEGEEAPERESAEGNATTEGTGVGNPGARAN